MVILRNYYCRAYAHTFLRPHRTSSWGWSAHAEARFQTWVIATFILSGLLASLLLVLLSVPNPIQDALKSYQRVVTLSFFLIVPTLALLVVRKDVASVPDAETVSRFSSQREQARKSMLSALAVVGIVGLPAITYWLLEVFGVRSS